MAKVVLAGGQPASKHYKGFKDTSMVGIAEQMQKHHDSLEGCIDYAPSGVFQVPQSDGSESIELFVTYLVKRERTPEEQAKVDEAQASANKTEKKNKKKR